MLTGNLYEPDKINLKGAEITSSNKKKLLGVLIYKKLSFDIYTKSLYKTAEQQFILSPE